MRDGDVAAKRYCSCCRSCEGGGGGSGVGVGDGRCCNMIMSVRVLRSSLIKQCARHMIREAVRPIESLYKGMGGRKEGREGGREGGRDSHTNTAQGGTEKAV